MKPLSAIYRKQQLHGIRQQIQRDGEAGTQVEDHANSPFGVLAFHLVGPLEGGQGSGQRDAILSRLVLNLFPALRSMPISVITSQHIIQMVQSITERGAAEMAKRCLGLSKQVFEYATTQGMRHQTPPLESNLPSLSRRRRSSTVRV